MAGGRSEPSPGADRPASAARRPGADAVAPISPVRHPGAVAGGPSSRVRRPGVVALAVAGGPSSRVRRPGVVALAVAVAVVLASASCTDGTVAPDARASSAVSSDATETPVPTATGAPTGTPQPAPATSDRPSPAAEPPVPSASPTSDGPAFTATVGRITRALAARMSASWREGCPVPLADLRHVTVTHHDFEGGVQQGELVVHADVADGIVRVFRALFEHGYPVRSMRLVDEYGASDDASMAADNTSAFNCRAVTGGSGWSEHAYGRAIDVNPRENPYVRGSHVAPPEGAPFVDRREAPGVIRAGDAVVEAFAAEGWQWGGYWERPIDYQHFSTTGR